MPDERSFRVRSAFDEAVAAFLGTAAGIDDDQWGRPVTDAWTVAEVFAHLVRGMAVISEYLDADLPAQGEILPGAAGYFRTALDAEGVHRGIADRGVASARDMGADRLGRARTVAAATLERVAATADDCVLVHFAGPVRFLDYLESRIVEVVLHTFDLQTACGLEVSAPSGALAVVDAVLVDLADRADPVALALALSGRSAAGVRCDVLG